MHKRHNICFWSSANYKGSLCLHWGVHKESGLSRPQTSPNDHQELVRFFTIKSPQRRGQYKLFEIHHNLGDFWTTLVHLGDKSLRETNARRSLMKCLLEDWVGHSREWLKSLLGSLDWSEAWGREVLTSRKVGSKYFQVNWVANRAEGWGGPFIAPEGI
jgi:hypothetical protein